MDKILFINLTEYVKENYTIEALGISSLATILKQNKNYDVEIIDFQYIYSKGKLKWYDDYEVDINNMCEYIISKLPKVVSVYTMCNTYHIAVLLSKKIKEMNKEIKIIFGGPQATLTANETLKAFPWIDLIGLGEGENTISSIIDAIINNKDLSDIEGIAYIRNNEIINSGLPPLILNLDKLPTIDYSFMDLNGVKGINVDVGRGCPFSCTFCSTKNFWQRKFRIKSPKRIVEEIKYFTFEYDIKEFSFMHDLFTVDKKKIIEFCDLIKEENLNISWTCSSRVDTIDEEMMIKMSNAGCKRMYLGIESGSVRMQKIIHKNLNILEAYKTIELLLKHNFELRLSFIYGFPEETEDDVRDTLNMIIKLVNKHIDLKNSFQLHRLAFFPGTELTKSYLNQLEYSEENNSTILFGNNFNNEVFQIINDNKEVFSQYYEYRTDLRDKLALLEKFIPLIYLRTISNFRVTYKLLMNFYNNDILQFFYDYKKFEEITLKELSFFQINKGHNKTFRAFESLKNFINEFDFGKIDELIKQVSYFEFCTAEFLYNSSLDEDIKTFKLDVYNIIKNDSSENFNYPITLKFIRTNNDSIKVEKVIS